MDIINILPDRVANQIAAGEVVDRPASAVKELLENAIDAGATSIQLIVKDAGRTLIQVIDNGCGMSDIDARLCFERHATSKIHRADDLFAIRTMGFRGEALASIAAVAQVELKTRQHDNELGTTVVIEGSDVKDQSPCNCTAGTSIAVKNLFYNIPARRNFLKRDSIELSHIEEIFRRVALANYSIAFSFHHNGKLLYDLGPGNFGRRIAGLFSNNCHERLYHIEEETEPVKIFGYVGKPEYVKHSRGEQYLFVNGRFIKHPGLSAAIERAYSELIPDRTYPAYFVLLEVDPARLDVNIHPTKTEVRFIDEQTIFAILRAATKKALGQFSLATEIEFNPSTEIDFSPAPKDYIPSQPTVSYNPFYNPFKAGRSDGTDGTDGTDERTERIFGLSDERTNGLSDGTDFRTGGLSDERTERIFGLSDYPNIRTSDNPNIRTSEYPNNPNIQSSEYPNNLTIRKSDNPNIQFSRYIVTTMKSGIVVIDSQRAHERILYERLLARRQAGQASAQQLLFPVNCRFNAADSEMLGELLPELRQVGFVIEPLAQNSFVVTATPPDVDANDIQSLLETTIGEYKSSMLQKINERDKTVCACLAKQMSVRQGQALKPEEMQQLIADLFSCQAPAMSPSGRRTMFILGEHDIAERLK